MGKKERRAKKEKEKMDIQNNDLQKEGKSSQKKCKTEADVMDIQDISRHSSCSGKLGPILPSFSHAPCSVPLLAAADPHCSIEVQWKGDKPQPRWCHLMITVFLNSCSLILVSCVSSHNKLIKKVLNLTRFDILMGHEYNSNTLYLANSSSIESDAG